MADEDKVPYYKYYHKAPSSGISPSETAAAQPESVEETAPDATAAVASWTASSGSTYSSSASVKLGRVAYFKV